MAQRGEFSEGFCGSLAFWSGRPIWSNPCVGGAAAEWRKGWTKAEAHFLERNGEPQHDPGEPYAPEVLAKFRPAEFAIEMPARPLKQSQGFGRKLRARGFPSRLLPER